MLSLFVKPVPVLVILIMELFSELLCGYVRRGGEEGKNKGGVCFFLKDLFIYLREREHESGKDRRRGREDLQQTPR